MNRVKTRSNSAASAIFIAVLALSAFILYSHTALGSVVAWRIWSFDVVEGHQRVGMPEEDYESKAHVDIKEGHDTEEMSALTMFESHFRGSISSDCKTWRRFCLRSSPVAV